MNLVSKDEIDILNKRIEKLEKKIAENKLKKKLNGQRNNNF